MLALLADPGTWLTLVTLAALEIVLGVDNIVFLSLIVARLPPADRARARLGGLLLAMVTRVALLVSVTTLIGLTRPLFALAAHAVSARDLVLFGGGVFLLVKTASELVPAARAAAGVDVPPRTAGSMLGIIVQIALIDVVFSIDSVFTAVGLSRELAIMIAAIVLSIVGMLFLAGPVGAFIERHRRVKTLALAFLLLISVSLLGDAFHLVIPQGYLYGAVGFAAFVELLDAWGRPRASGGGAS